MSVQPRAALRQVRPYKPGKPIEEVQRELGLKRIIKLASNENPLGPSPRAVAAIQGAAAGVALYPEATSPRLREALARRLGVSPDHILVGNGSDEILLLLARAYLDPGDQVVLPAPTFPMYEIAARIAGSDVTEVPLRHYCIDLEAVAAALTPKTKLIALCFPNNPTGTSASREALDGFMERVPPGAIVVLDQAYREYVTDPAYPDGLDYVGRWPNVIVLRTFSKIYGLAGLRVGYGIARPALLDPLWTVREPFSVNLVAQAAALAALEDEGHIDRSRAVNEAGKRQLAAGLTRLGLQVLPTEANFVCIDLGRPAGEVFDALVRRGIIVRSMAGHGLPRHIRVTIGTEEENHAFLTALAEVLAG